MPKRRLRRFGVSTVVAATATLVLAVSATAATTYQVAGQSIVVDQDTGKTVMRGGLIGDWYYTSAETIATSPLLYVKGTEAFVGCLDRKLNGKCNKGDPWGTLFFRFDYWAQYDAQQNLVWGTCTHPITGGTGAFAGAAGVLAMVDTQTPQGVQTAYIGNVTLSRATGSSRARAKTSAVARTSTAPRGC
ncbi:hypothetical protein [Solirubrobacter soli]|uniref:hypothetical protein n=1 Tax=Solirubrobacter soli TaxID=363832 RepID=UPI00040C1D6C|nr:hypothetical protein [Solirubrobacter soli]